jgi:hypothetical protein
MFGFDKLLLTLAYDTIYFIIALIILILYSVYVYRVTIPQISKFKKIVLVSLRSIALFLLLLIFFEPILTLIKKISIEPTHLIFIDNSRSMLIDDGTNRTEQVNLISKEFLRKGNQNFDYYIFGNEPRKIEKDSLSILSYSDGITNLSSIFSSIEAEEINAASFTIISDGVFTDGSSPLYAAEKLKIPVFTIGIGDTSQRNDMEIRKVQFNEFLYAGTPSAINSTVLNTGYGNQSARVELFENDILLEQRTITLSEKGIQNESFVYTPESGGEKKLQLRVTGMEDEFTYANNIQIFYVNVLSNKIKVAILAGSPSVDLSFIKNSLLTDENLSVSSVTQVSAGRFLENNYLNVIDSADVFFLIGFPADNTPQEVLNLIRQKIIEERKPFFISLSPGFKWNNLSIIQSELPVTLRSDLSGIREVQPEIVSSQVNNPLLHNSSHNPISIWNTLPPVPQPKMQFQAKPESRVLSYIKVNNTIINEPLIVTRSFSGRRSIVVLGYDLWRWKLKTATKKTDLFDSFINNSVKWLHITEAKEQVKIKTSKKNYSLGEKIEFSAQVYDESFNPVVDAGVKVQVSSNNKKYEIDLSGVGSGIYECEINLTETGDFSFEGEARQNGVLIGTDRGNFNIGELDVEMINPRMNFELMMQLAAQTGGNYYLVEEYENIFSDLDRISKFAVKEKVINSEISLWSNEWLLILCVFFFAAEWFIRKREGML